MARFIIYVILWALCSVWYHVDREHFDIGEFAVPIGLFWPIALPIKFVSWLIRKIKK